MSEDVQTTAGADFPDKDKTLVQIIYYGAAASAVVSIVPILAFIGVLVWIGLLIVAYIKRSDVGEIAKSHFSNYITVFWMGLLGLIVAGVLGFLFFPVGILIGLAVLVWQLYRLIKGILRMLDNRAYG